MITRHQNELLSRLEQVTDIGYAVIRKPELLLWYDQERVTKNIWRDIYEKWLEVGSDDSDKHPLLIADAEGVWTLIWGEGLTPASNAWFKDVRDRAKLKAGMDAEVA